MNVKKIAKTAVKVSLSAVVGHKVGCFCRERILRGTQTYNIEGDKITFNKKPDGVRPIMTHHDAVCEANGVYLDTAIISGLGTYIGLNKIEEVVNDHLEKKKMKKIKEIKEVEVVSEEPISETPVTEEVTEE